MAWEVETVFIRPIACILYCHLTVSLACGLFVEACDNC